MSIAAIVLSADSLAPATDPSSPLDVLCTTWAGHLGRRITGGGFPMARSLLAYHEAMDEMQSAARANSADHEAHSFWYGEAREELAHFLALDSGRSPKIPSIFS